MSFDLRRWLNLWSVAALGLCAVYGGVAFLAQNPTVSDAYRAYYIERSTDRPVWVAEKTPGILPPLQPDTIYGHSAAEIMLIGWSTPSPKHVWSLGHDAALVFAPPVLGDADAVYELVLTGTYLGGQQRVITTVGDTQINTIYQAGVPIVVPLPAGALDEVLVEVQLDLPDARQPGTADPRVLAFALQSVLLRQASP